MRNQYDMIVVGGGPGGAMAARHAAMGGASVLVLEKDRDIGLPVRCAEGISERALSLLVPVRERWIACEVNNFLLVAPDGTSLTAHTGITGYILHRRLFDADLMDLAVEAGAQVLTRAYVHDLVFEDGVITGVKMVHLGKAYSLKAKIVIGADGVESRVGRWAGLKTHTKMVDMESCVQMTLAKIKIDPTVAEFHMGHKIAPGGYLWVFPKGKDTANVGLGISGKYTKEARPIDYLQEFIDKRFPGASPLSMVAGGVPSAPTLNKIVTHGLMLVGDAARQINPVTGGGIICAMIAGKIAGETAAEAIKADNVTEKFLSKYAKQWNKEEGRRNESAYKLKKAIVQFPDEEFNGIAKTLSSIPFEERTVYNVFKTSLIKHPKLILEAAKVFLER